MDLHPFYIGYIYRLLYIAATSSNNTYMVGCSFEKINANAETMSTWIPNGVDLVSPSNKCNETNESSPGLCLQSPSVEVTIP